MMKSSFHRMASVGLMTSLFLLLLLLAISCPNTVEAFQPAVVSPRLMANTRSSFSSVFPLHVVASEKEDKTTSGDSAKQSLSSTTSSVEDATEKYGLEVGLFESMKQKDGGESAKSLLKKYGIAYLATSIPLAIISFLICYALVSNGVDVSALLSKIGIESNAGSASETAGTFAIAYAAHKAASPIRFPPTVVLTPVVAKLIGKEPEMEIDEEKK